MFAAICKISCQQDAGCALDFLPYGVLDGLSDGRIVSKPIFNGPTVLKERPDTILKFIER